MSALDRPILTLAELQQFDPQAPVGSTERRFACPLPACADKSVGATHRSLTVNTNTGLWRCHRCGAGGKLQEHWRTGGASFPPQQRAALTRAFALAPATPPSRPQRATTWQAAAEATLPLAGTPGESYLAGRGIPLALAQANRVRYAPDWLGSPSVVFAVVNAEGQPVAAQGRAIRGDRKITLGPKSDGVYVAGAGLPPNPVAIVEAPIDALSLALCGITTIALLGTDAPGWLPARLAFFRVLLATDQDEAGEKAARVLTPRLRSFGAQVIRWRVEGAKDANELLLKDHLRLGTSVLWPTAEWVEAAA